MVWEALARAKPLYDVMHCVDDYMSVYSHCIG